MDDREKAKQIYQNLRQRGHRPTLQEFADKTESLLGRRYSRSTIKSWYTEGNWGATQYVSDVDDPEISETRNLLEVAYGYAISADTPANLAASSKAFLALVSEIPESLLLEYQSSITDVRFEIANTIKTQQVKPTALSSLSRTWTGLKRYVVYEIVDEEEGVDPDELLLGVSNGNV